MWKFTEVVEFVEIPLLDTFDSVSWVLCVPFLSNRLICRHIRHSLIVHGDSKGKQSDEDEKAVNAEAYVGYM